MALDIKDSDHNSSSSANHLQLEEENGIEVSHSSSLRDVTLPLLNQGK